MQSFHFYSIAYYSEIRAIPVGGTGSRRMVLAGMQDIESKLPMLSKILA